MPKIIQNVKSGDLQLTPNFYLSEFLASEIADRNGIVNTPDPLAVQNLFKTAATLEQVRKLLGNRAIFVSSGYRCLALNRLLHSDDSSDHVRGEAVDFVCRGFGTPLQVAAAIAKSDIPFGQLIMEGSWVHLSLPDARHNREVLTAHFAPGKKTTYTKGLPL